jgi:tetratricopeptide (TPR) repeat protein
MKTQGGLLAFNNFLSTSKNRDVSLRFARRTITTSSLVGVLFVMKIDPSVSTTPFANIRNVSYYQREEEILFSMHSVFRIGLVKQIDKTESMREETRGLTGWNRLGQLLIKLGQFNKAEELYEILLKQTANEGEKAGLYHMSGVVKDGQGNYAEAARFYQNSLKINQKILSPNHFDFIATYNNIGEVCKNMGEYWKALSYYEKALEIFKRTFPANHPHLDTFYNNIGTVYTSMGDYSKAL